MTCLCVIGDFNEDICLEKEHNVVQCLQIKDSNKWMKPTRDSGTLIDHLYTNQKLQIQTDVSDCYYSDHDYVLCTITKDSIST